ncbi:ABC transporter substrate-binding protein [Clostridiales bacterium TF09-2AC]|uniref:ABC transporter substrate-binding protein n=1 Tax=Enterocloster hominis (ex Hitch et al. 2024) TaxID=1917870 RepID=A0ABV1DG21_9FIRM|nr:ABC transporter substrate-binding protein [Lachnoclostridium pacaense]EEQ60103.1 NMT1/THI5-like protein [Clostridiales bacterium 1_7_47FAA]MCC2819527.1 ABC transporter substrate-binding protein [Lachnoclostridium pacaense]RJW44312.1 ABC transporter substrate-binding protein [Clostridiales bacterium TF09-2AC]
MKKTYTVILAAALLGIALTGCAGASGRSSQAAGDRKEQSLKEITFVLDWTPNTNHTGLYVAQEKGYFKDAGLNVTMVQPPENGAEVLAASGKAQFAMSFQDSLAPAFSGGNKLPVTAVAAVIQHNTSGIISRKGEGMDRPRGLEGRQYATWDLPIEKATIREVVEADGGDFDKVKLIPSMVTDEVTALKTKSVDAIWIFYGWAGVKTELEGLETDYFAFADVDPVFDFYTPVIIANNDFLENEPDTAKAFMEAVSRGYMDAARDPQAAADILCKAAPELDPELIKASQIYLADKYQADAAQWGYISPERWNAYYDWLSRNGLTETPIEENTGFSNEYLPKDG